MAFKLVKKYPENYSDDIVDVIECLTLKGGSQPFLQGSGKLKFSYPSDYDMAQYIPVNKNIKKAVSMWRTNKNEALKIYGHISFWDTSKITNMEALFFNNKSFNDDQSRAF